MKPAVKQYLEATLKRRRAEAKTFAAHLEGAKRDEQALEALLYTGAKQPREVRIACEQIDRMMRLIDDVLRAATRNNSDRVYCLPVAMTKVEAEALAVDLTAMKQALGGGQ